MRVLLLLLLLAGCAADPGNGCRLEKLAELPIDVVARVPTLAVEINGRPARLVLDSGSDATVVTRRAAERLGVEATDQRHTVGAAGGPAPVGVARLDRLMLGGHATTGVRALLADAPGPPIDGVLGIDTLVAFEVEMDVPGRRAVFYRARTCAPALPPWEGRYVRLPVQQRPRSGHMFTGVVIDGQPLRGLLDSGASTSVLSLQAAADIGIGRRQMNELPTGRSQTLNAEGVQLRVTQAREMRIGADVIERPVLAIVDLPAFAGDLLIGQDYLGGRPVWFAFALGRVYVKL